MPLRTLDWSVSRSPSTYYYYLFVSTSICFWQICPVFYLFWMWFLLNGAALVAIMNGLNNDYQVRQYVLSVSIFASSLKTILSCAWSASYCLCYGFLSLSVVFMFGLLDPNSVTCPIEWMAEEDERCLCHRISKWENIHHLKVFVCVHCTLKHWISNVRTRNLFPFTFEELSRRKNCAFFLYSLWVRPIGWCYCLRVYLNTFVPWAHKENERRRSKQKGTQKANSKENKSDDDLYWNAKMMVPISTDASIMAIIGKFIWRTKRHNNNHCVLLIEFNRFVHLNLWHYYYYYYLK